MANQIRFGVGFDVDQAGLNSLKASLQEIQKITKTDFLKINKSGFTDVNSELIKMKSTASAVEDALTAAFNPKLNTINVTTFNNELNKSKLTVKSIYEEFSKAGTAGQISFQKLATTVLSTNTQLKQTSTILDKMATTLANTAKWNLASGAINTLTRSVQEAWGYVKALDGSLNDIQIVTQKSSESMAEFAQNANEAAKNLGATTTSYTNAALTFYQQGLSDEEVQARTDLTLKVSNASGLSADDAAEYVTAVLNGYKVGSEEAEAAMDVLANVGAHTASSLSELSEAMSKVSSTASTMGVSEEQLAASLATVIQTTRQDASTVGTAFKTIYMRISDIKAGTEDAEVSLGTYTKQMAEMGVNVLDEMGNLRDLGSVVEEIGGKWENMSREQQIALARTMAGTRQANNLLALFDNWDTYADALGYTTNATGTLQQQQDTYMESVKAHLNTLKASTEDIFDSLVNTEDINNIIDSLSKLANVTASWIDSIGGGQGVLLALGSTALNVFNRQIAMGISTMIGNIQKTKIELEDLKVQMSVIPEFKGLGNDAITQIAEMKQKVLEYGEIVTEEQQEEANNLIKQKAELLEKETALKANREEAQKLLDIMKDMSQYSGDVDSNAFQAFDDKHEARKTGNETQQQETSTKADNALTNNEKALDDLVDSTENAIAKAQSLRDALGEVETAATKEAAATNKTATSKKEIAEKNKAAAQAAKELATAQTELTERFANAEDDIAQTLSLIDQTSKEYRTLSQVLNENGQIDLSKLTTMNPEQLNTFITAFENAQKQIQQKAQQTRETLEAEATGASSTVRTQIDNVESRFNTFLKQLDLTKAIQNITTLASAMGQLVSAFNILRNLGNIWDDESLSKGEKMLQTITALSTAIPMLTMSLGGLNKVFKLVAVGEGAAALATKGYKVVTNEATGAQIAFNTALLANPLTWIVAGLAAAVAGLVLYSDHLEQVRQKEIEEAKAARDNALALKDELDSRNDLYQNYKSQLALYEKTGKNEDALREATLKLADAYNVQIDTMDLLAGRYDTINQKILRQQRDAAQEALTTAKQGLAGAEEAMLKEGASGQGWGDGAITFRDSTIGFQNVRDEYAFWKAMNDQIQELLADQIASGDLWSTGREGVQFVMGGIDNAEEFIEVYDAINTAITRMQNGLVEGMDKDTRKNSEDYQIAVQWLKDNKENYDKYIETQQLINESAEQLAEAEAALGAADIDISKISSLEDFESYRRQYIATLTDVLSREGINKSQQEIEELADKYLSTIDYIADYVKDADIASRLKEAMLSGLEPDSTAMRDYMIQIADYVNNLSTKDLELIASIGFDEGATMAEVDKILELARLRINKQLPEDVQTALGTVMDSLNDDKITKSDQKTYDEANQVLEAYLATADGIRGMTTAAEEWALVSSQGSLAQLEYLEDLSEAQTNYATNTIDNAKQEYELEKELLEIQQERLKEQASDMDELNKKVQEYEALMRSEGDKFDATSSAATAIFKDAQAYNEAADKCDEYNIAIQNVKSRIEELDDILADEHKLELEVDMGNVNDILTIGDNILNESEKIKQAAELIGEGFIVAAEDADALAKIFPEIYENAKVTEEGIVQLDKATVQALLGNQGVLLDGDVDTAVAKIDNEIAVLEAKKEAAEAQLKLWQSVAQGELDISDEALTAMAGGQEDFTNYLIQCGVDANTAQEAVAKAMAGNYDELARIAGNDAYQIDSALTTGIQDAANNVQSNSANMITSLFAVMRQAQEVGKAIAASSNGQVAGNGVGGAGGGATGGISYNGSVNSNNFKVSDAYKATAAGQFTSDKISAAELDISSYTSAIAQMQALKARLLANQKDTQAALDGASNGTGGKTDKDKSGSDKNKDKDAKHIDELEEEFDAYHDIDIEIKNITADLERLQKQQSKLSGEALIKNLNKQLELLKKQRDAYAEKIQLATMEANSYKEMLKSYGATFTDDGQISNYYSLLQKELNAVNQAIADYNALSAEDQEAAEADVEAAKKRYETLKNLISNYDTLINDTIPGLENQIEDALYKEIEIHITEFDMEVNLKLDLVDAEKQWNEFKRKIIDGFDDDSVTGAAKEALDNISDYYTSDLLSSQTEKVYKLIGDKTIGGQSAGYIAQIDKISGYESGNLTNKQKTEVAGIADENPYVSYDAETGRFVVDREAALAALKETASGLREELLYLQEQEKAVNEAFLKSIDNIQTAYDKKGEILEFFNDQIQHDMKMMELLYGDEAYAKMDTYYQKQVESDIQQVNSLQEQAAYWKRLMDAARDAGDSDAYDKYRDNWMKSIKDLNSSIETWAEDITKQYANAVKKIMQELNNQLTDNLGLDYANEELTLLNQNAENYLDTVNSAYAVQSLQNKWQTAIDNTDSISGQRKLNALMEEQMEMLEKKGQLSEYDIQRAEKEYELALRQIALEEAQQNKSKMRLKKDANGNYTYQFVSDEDSIAAAKQELADAQNELYNFDKSAYTNNLNEIYSTWSEFQQKVADAYVTYANDQDKLTEHIALLQEQYGEKINALTEQNCTIRNNLQDSAFTSLAGMYNTDVANFQTMTNDEKDIIMNQLIPQWDSGVQTMADKFGGDDEKSFKSICESTFNKLTGLATQYQGVLTSIGTTSDAVSQQVSSEQTTLEAEANRALQATKEEYEAVGLLKQEVENLTAAYKASYAEAVAATTAAYAFMKAQKEVDAYQASQNDSDTSSSPSSSSDTSSSSSGTPSSKSNTPSAGSGNGATASSDIIKGIAAAIWCESNSGWGNDPGRKQKLIAKFNQSTRDSVQSYINNHSANGDLYNYWVNTLHRNASAYHYDKFKRGGLADYTGLAWLDGTPTNPELVLNANDTANMLSAVSVLRGIMDTLNGSTLDAIAARLSGLGNFGATVGGSSDSLEQTVYITATFEGQTEANQIQTALDNLVNIASQRAYRNKK